MYHEKEVDIPYMYGRLNKEVEKNTYTGKDTTTANTVVDNDTNEISVNVNTNEVLKNVYTKDQVYNKEEVDEKISEIPSGSFTIKTYILIDTEDNPGSPQRWELPEGITREQFEADLQNAKLVGLGFPNICSGLLPKQEDYIQYSYASLNIATEPWTVTGIYQEFNKLIFEDPYYIIEWGIEPFLVYNQYEEGIFIHSSLAIYLVL